MDHPPLEVLLRSPILDSEISDHVGTCQTCRRIVELARMDAAKAGVDARELPVETASMVIQGEHIGSGGMGHTFRARDRVLWRDVAMKVPLGIDEVQDAFLHETLRRRFEREARMTAQLQHPGIVPVYQAGCLPGGEPFYTMRLIEGEPLSAQLARASGLAERLALLPAVIAASDAIAYAHSRGFVHRDIKPDNIICGAFGETLVIDWGLATSVGEPPAGLGIDCRETELSLTEYGIGTPPYVAPEQARGGSADVRADVYAIGAVLYELLAGVPPYGRRDPATLRERLLAGPPPAVTDLAPATPLAAIITKAMARDPEQRYVNASELASDLRRFQAGLLVSAHRYTIAERLSLVLRRHKLAVAVAGVALLFLVIIGGVSAARVVAERDAANAARYHAERAQRDALLRMSSAQGAMASLLARDATRRIDAMSLGAQAVAEALSLGEAPSDVAVQGLVDALVAGPLLYSPANQTTGIDAVEATSDGARLVTVDRATNLSVRRLPAGELENTYTIGLRHPEFLALSRDGRYAFVCGWDDHAEIVELTGGRVRGLERDGLVRLCVFDGDGTGWTAASSLARWDLDTGQVLERHALGAQASALAVSPQGMLAVGTVEGELVAREPQTRRVWRRALAHRGPVTGLAFTTDGVLYSAGEDGTLRSWTVTATQGLGGGLVYRSGLGRLRVLRALPTGALLVAARGRESADPGRGWIVDLARRRSDVEFAGLPTASPDGWTLVTAARSRVSLLDVRTGQPLAAIEAPAPLGGARPLGSNLVAIWDVEGRLFLWDVRTGASTGLLLGPTSALSGLAVGANGTRVATLGLDGTGWIWDPASGHAISRAVAPPGVATLHAKFDPTGRSIALLGDDQRLYMHDVATGTALAHPVSDAPVSAWDFTHDGELVTADPVGHVVIWSGSSPRVRWDVDQRVTAVAAVDERIITAHPGGGVRVFDRKDGTLVASRPPQAGSVEAVMMVLAVESGRRLVLGATGGDTLVVDAATLLDVARVPGVFASALGDDRWATATPDGRVRVVDGADITVELGPGTAVSAVALGRGETHGQLAIGRRDGSVELWHLATAERAVTLAPAPSPPLGPPVGLAISSDGTSLLVAYASGAVRSYAISARAALGRAYALLHRLGRASDADVKYPGADVPTRRAAGRPPPALP